MAFSITVKNTFIALEKPTEEPVPSVRRSSSVPRAFKPLQDVFLSDDSTDASEKGAPDLSSPSWTSDSEQDSFDLCSNCTQDDDFVIGFGSPCGDCASSCGSSSCNEEMQKSRVILSLADTVTEKQVRAKLRSQAAPFKSAIAPPSELTAVIAHALELLAKSKSILDVQVNYGGVGTATTIVAKTSKCQSDTVLATTTAKLALLNAAQQSDNTYVFGYGNKPFRDLDVDSFSVSLCCVPDDHRNTACWDVYEQGFCPRRSTCRWDHPADKDIMKIIICFKEWDFQIDSL